MRTTGLSCRSQAATAVCVPGDARSMIVARRPDRTLLDDSRLFDVKYARLGDKHGRFAAGDRRRTAVTLPMVTKKEINNSQTKTKSKTKTDITQAIQNTVTTTASNDLVFRVVVLKVSIHCQGCAGKVRKHLSKMEGVTSFSIDVESKRVTVMGHVSPAGVLESMSKVKKAELLVEN
ncbi:hypothetical protein LUZ60_003043 [Juncus effusus]|nr:hypothetical protein LUZ60_003043 [Juncus effusus]